MLRSHKSIKHKRFFNFTLLLNMLLLLLDAALVASAKKAPKERFLEQYNQSKLPSIWLVLSVTAAIFMVYGIPIYILVIRRLIELNRRDNQEHITHQHIDEKPLQEASHKQRLEFLKLKYNLLQGKLYPSEKEKLSRWMLTLQAIEEEFSCPFSHAIMNTPTTLSSGITADKEFLQAWFKENSFRMLKCPITNKPLMEKPHTVLNRNIMIDNAIKNKLTLLELQFAVIVEPYQKRVEQQLIINRSFRQFNFWQKKYYDMAKEIYKNEKTALNKPLKLLQ